MTTWINTQSFHICRHRAGTIKQFSKGMLEQTIMAQILWKSWCHNNQMEVMKISEFDKTKYCLCPQKQIKMWILKICEMLHSRKSVVFSSISQSISIYRNTLWDATKNHWFSWVQHFAYHHIIQHEQNNIQTNKSYHVATKCHFLLKRYKKETTVSWYPFCSMSKGTWHFHMTNSNQNTQ